MSAATMARLSQAAARLERAARAATATAQNATLQPEDEVVLADLLDAAAAGLEATERWAYSRHCAEEERVR